DRQVEDPQGPSALLDREEIRQERRRDRPEGGLADPDHPPCQKKPEVGGSEGRSDGGGAPEDRSQGEDAAPGVAIAEVPEDRRGRQVDQEEEGPEEAEAGVADRKVPPDERLDGGDDVPIEVIEKIEAGQEREGVIRMETGAPAI